MAPGGRGNPDAPLLTGASIKSEKPIVLGVSKMNINLKLLHTFLLVAEHASFRRAAEESNRSQAAVSLQVKSLEEQLGVALFHRTTRRVLLTSEGEHLLLCTRKSLQELEIGLRHIKDAINVTKGHITFACVPTVASTRLPEILLAFHEAHPSITLEVNELSTDGLLENVRRQEVDFAIATMVENATDFHFETIHHERIFAMLPAQFQLRGRREISLAELARFPTMKLSGATGLHDTLSKAISEQGLTMNSPYGFQRTSSQIAMAAAGLAVAILPEMAVPLALQAKLQCLPIVNPALGRVLCIVTLRGRTLSPIASKLVAIIKQRIGTQSLPEAST